MPTDKKRKIRNTIAITMALVMMLLGIAALDDSNVNPSYGADENLVDNPNYVDRQIIVVFNENVDRASAADIVAFALSEELISERKASKGIKNIRDSINIKKIKTDNNMMLISLDTDVDEKAAAKEIAKNPDVDSAQPNYIYTLNKESESVGNHKSGDWYLEFIGANKAQKLITNKNKNAEKVIVASLDTGSLTIMKHCRVLKPYRRALILSLTDTELKWRDSSRTPRAKITSRSSMWISSTRRTNILQEALPLQQMRLPE